MSSTRVNSQLKIPGQISVQINSLRLGALIHGCSGMIVTLFG
jgi:hypothetical protein